MKIKYLIFSLLLFYSCTKNNSGPALQFTGRVIDYSTNKVIANANVTLTLYYYLVQPWNSPVTNQVYYTTSDAKGYYEFNIPQDTLQNYYTIFSSKSGYAFVDAEAGIVDIIDNKTTYSNTSYLDVASIFQINFNDNNTTSQQDTVNLLVSFSASPTHPFYAGSGYSREHIFVISNGGTSSFSDSTSFKMYDRVSYSYYIHNNGIVASYQSSNIPLTEFDTKVVDVNY